LFVVVVEEEVEGWAVCFQEEELMGAEGLSYRRKARGGFFLGC